LIHDRVVWDFDGVLVDSRAEAWRAASNILALVGIKVDIHSQEMFRQYFTQYGVFPEASRKTLRAMHRLIMQNRAHLLNIHPCLGIVGRLNVPAEIVTSGSEAVARSFLREHANLIVNIRGEETDSKDALLSTLSRRAIFITDTIVDIARCHKHDVTVIAVGWGYDPTIALRNSEPNFLAESSSQLEEILSQLEVLKPA
jgi:phosphoglycolate phosphatase-like HAD superfamily hydrolase